MTYRNRHRIRCLLVLTVLAAVATLALTAPEVALAGTGGDEFDDIWSTLESWIKGTLGQIIVLAMVIVGIVAGVARQSIIAFAVGVGAGLGLYTSPDIIEEIVSATVAKAGGTAAPALDKAPAVAEVLTQTAGLAHP